MIVCKKTCWVLVWSGIKPYGIQRHGPQSLTQEESNSLVIPDADWCQRSRNAAGTIPMDCGLDSVQVGSVMVSNPKPLRRQNSPVL